MPDMPEIQRGHDAPPAPDTAETRAEALALALMGAGAMDQAMLSPDATWQCGDAPVMVGRGAILAALGALRPPRKIYIEQVVTQGKAGTVSGRLVTDTGRARLFCHVIRYTSAAAQQIAQIVSFDHGVKAG